MLETLVIPCVFLVAVAFVLLNGGAYIRFLQKRYLGQYIREDGPQAHHSKAGTPTAGGVLILSSMAFATLVAFAFRPEMATSPYVWSVLGVTLVMGGLGLWDDLMKIAKKHNKGLTGYTKLLIQGGAGLALGFFTMTALQTTEVSFFNLFHFNLGWFYPIFTAMTLISVSNAVNLTDGLDGLASGTVICSLLAFAMVFSLALGGLAMTDATFDLGVMSWILMGATLGFLYFNRHPARIFMGDCGSLALGGAIGALAVLGRMEFWLFLIGGVFVLEALSVILQVISFKTTGRRIFRMSPLHHHFELSGWHETKVVKTFILLQFLLCLLAIFLYNIG